MAEQLVSRHDFLDKNKIGIFGHSSGGFMSTAAMLVYPDFSKLLYHRLEIMTIPFTIVGGVKVITESKEENENGKSNMYMK